MKTKLYVASLALLLALTAACTPTPHDVQEAPVALTLYPDYQEVTMPANIAPLNFMLRGDYDAVEVKVTGRSEMCLNARGNKVIWDMDQWRKWLTDNSGDSATVVVTARRGEDRQWLSFPGFKWYVSEDSIDAYLTYRLIEPGYEVWDNVCIEERCTENFEHRLLADGRDLGNRCMNCHTHGGDRGQYSFFYIRGKEGGAIVNRDGRLSKLTLKSPQMRGGTVYGDWHPSGRYAVYSTNVIIPAYHAQAARRLEVYDTQSDLCVADFECDTMLLSPSVSNTPGRLETFPCFSADGRWIYYCGASNPCGDTIPSARDLRQHIDELHYSLCRISFDAETGTFGSQIDTLYDATASGAGSINFPKCSPDGRWLCLTHSDFGTFPIWHAESELWLLDTSIELPADSLAERIVHSGQNGTYHSWSHNSKWIAFASKRTDGQYGRVHLMHIGLSKPLVLPQADPEMDDWELRSYNIPDLSTLPAPYGHREVKTLLEGVQATQFK